MIAWLPNLSVQGRPAATDRISAANRPGFPAQPETYVKKININS
jgi:hypothetical protein